MGSDARSNAQAVLERSCHHEDHRSVYRRPNSRGRGGVGWYELVFGRRRGKLRRLRADPRSARTAFRSVASDSLAAGRPARNDVFDRDLASPGALSGPALLETVGSAARSFAGAVVFARAARLELVGAGDRAGAARLDPLALARGLPSSANSRPINLSASSVRRARSGVSGAFSPTPGLPRAARSAEVVKASRLA